MWISPEARGLGLGRRLLKELEACALSGGARIAHIETSAVLTEALALYRSPRDAAQSQYWMLVVMVAFTSLGLWLLSAVNT